MDRILHLSSTQQLTLLCDLFQQVSVRDFNLQVPDDFIPVALKGMQKLNGSGKSNIIYGLYKGLGTCRPDGNDSLFPTSKMPMGLVEYVVNFFITKAGNKVSTSI